MYEGERGARYAGNERGSRRENETLVGLQFLPAAVDRDAANAARIVSRDGSRGW